MKRLRIALTKGRIEKEAVKLFDRAEFDASALQSGGRKLVIEMSGMEVVLAKPADVVTFVERGVCDVGIVGKDTITESGGVFYEVLDLGFGRCRFVLAAPEGKDFYNGFGVKTVATKYPNVAKRFFVDKTMDVEIIKIDGSVELAPVIGLSDAIVDIVETGRTLKENGLAVIEEIAPLSTRVIVNTASMKLKKTEIEEFLYKLEESIDNGL